MTHPPSLFFIYIIVIKPNLREGLRDGLGKLKKKHCVVLLTHSHIIMDSSCIYDFIIIKDQLLFYEKEQLKDEWPKQKKLLKMGGLELVQNTL